MKPHPRIRKTIKWAGAAVTVLLVVVWIGSGWSYMQWASGKKSVVLVGSGEFVVNARFYPWASLGPWPRVGVTDDRAHWLFDFEWTDLPTWLSVRIPLWVFALGAGLPTILAWRLDTLARRRVRVNHCPKCNYDCAGLGGGVGAVCPECGAGASMPVASQPTKSAPHA